MAHANRLARARVTEIEDQLQSFDQTEPNWGKDIIEELLAHVSFLESELNIQEPLIRSLREDRFELSSNIRELKNRLAKFEGLLSGKHPNCLYLASPMFCHKCGFVSSRFLDKK